MVAPSNGKWGLVGLTTVNSTFQFPVLKVSGLFCFIWN